MHVTATMYLAQQGSIVWVVDVAANILGVWGRTVRTNATRGRGREGRERERESKRSTAKAILAPKSFRSVQVCTVQCLI